MPVPDVGGENCLMMDLRPFRNGLHRLNRTCRGVPYGMRYMTVYLNTLNHRHEDNRKVYPK